MTAFPTARGGGSIHLELPPARTEPLDADRALWPAVPYRVRFLARQLIGGDEVFLAVRTGTKTDVGCWLLRGRVWLFALGDALVLVAAGAWGLNVLARRVPYRLLRESHYNHVTGRLALAPVDDLPFRGLRMDPLDGYRALAQIYHED